MKCTFCKEKLNPYLIEQICNENNIEIKCWKCRKSNFVSWDTYFHITNDWDMPIVQPINNKLPQDMNIIILSTERCGVSWVARVISQVHYKMFSTSPEWNFEISRVEARKKHLPLPQGWNTVYNVKPQALLEHGFDRVLVIQRDMKELFKAHMLYNRDELNNEYVAPNEEAMINQLERYYKIVYEEKINNPKYLKVHLEDLNKYTVATFNEILDFLNFPSHSRPIIVPTSPPHRNWEAYSSILPKKHELCKRLRDIDKVFNDK